MPDELARTTSLGLRHHLPCPLLVVPQPSTAPPRAFANARQSGLLAGFGEAREPGFSAVTPAAGLADAAALLQPDLLVLVARRRSLLGSLFHQSATAAVVREAQVPVLVLPEHAA